jgi:type I restriction enzyme, R subunit
LSEDELALFDLLRKENISKADRERVKQAGKELLSSLQKVLSSMPNWTKNAKTQADVKIFILDKLYTSLPRPPFTDQETDQSAERLYDFVWQRSESGLCKAAA